MKISLIVKLSMLLALMPAVSIVLAETGQLPPPTGEYTVGMTRYVFVDKGRPELFTEDPDDHREITVALWYPGELLEDARRTSGYTGASDRDAATRTSSLQYRTISPHLL